MIRILQKILICSVLLMSISKKTNANHLFGADLNYTWVSGNTYTIRLTIYGDCRGAFTPGSSFNGLNGAVPKVYIYNGIAKIDSVNLVQQGPGVEVSPVCAAQVSQTYCVSPFPTGTVQGVKRFIYTANYTLSGTSANWMFQFNGDLPSSAGPFIAGRSPSIGNINSASSIMRLQATLNNLAGNNSSPVYTTIPTPFFCVNKPASYNPGTVDPNATDVLSFALVDGLEALPPNSTGGFVVYLPTYTAVTPIDVVPGSQIFNTTNGQLDLTPNTVNNYLIVSRVTETRGATVVGTSMREMVFVIQSCNNNPPSGSVSNGSAGANMINATTLSICKERGPLTFNINPTDVDGDIINVGANGLPAGATFNVTNNNSTSPLGTFNWNLSTVTPGTYTFFVTFTDQGCPLSSKQTTAYTVIVLPNPGITYQLVTAATCLRKAVFRVTPVGTNSPYTITFGSTTRTGVTGQITDSLAPGTYTFTITGLNGCTHDTSITIASPATVKPGASMRKSICSTLANGSVTLSATSGTPPYTYSQGAGPYTATTTYSPLAAGTYTFHIKDALGCIKDTTITVADSLVVTSVVTVTDVLCNGQSTGAIQVVGNGGTPTYTYALGAGVYSATNTFSSLAAGTYALHIKDNLGCIKDTNALVKQPTVIVPTVTIQNVKCNGGNDGRITISASGGTPGYTYALDAGAFSGTTVYNTLIAGNYVVHIKDANNCLKDTTVTVTQPTVLGLTLTVTNVLCNGGSTGTVTVNATGGTTAYQYAADANAFGASNILTGLNVGSHAIHLKDANGCTKDTTATLTEPTVLKISFTSANPTCNAGSNGTITVAGAGGTTAYQYALDAGPFGASGAFTGLTAGTYALHLKDANGCLKDTTATLGQPTAITVTAAVKRPRCTPLVNGAVTITAANGTPGYTYARGTGTYSASNIFTNLGSGTYVFHVKDANNCIKDTTITVTDSIFVHATTVMTPTTCFGATDGALAITPSGGDPAYTFALNAGAYSATNPRTNLAAGAYVLHVKDANGCILDTNVSVTQPTIVVPSVVVTQPLCYLDSNGVIVAGASGGTPGYTFAFGTGTYSATTTFSNLKTGTYTIHVKDLNGCQHDTTFVMGQPTELKFGFINMTHIHCFDGTDGTITVRANGGTPAYTYAADAGTFQAANLLTGLNAGVHLIHLKDANGCPRDTNIRLFQPTEAFVLVTSVTNPTCEGFKDGEVKIAATGGTPGYTYSDDNIAFDTQKTYSRLPEGSYTFYLKDANGCVKDTTVQLIGYPHIVINGASIIQPSCYGLSDGSFALNVTGGNAPLTYVMQKPIDTNMTGAYDSLLSRKYTVRITDAKGCFKDTSITINQPDSLSALTTVLNNDCNDYDNGGGVTTTVTGGTTPYRYLWSTVPAQTGDHITGMPNGSYFVIVSDAHNCTDTAKAVVGYDNCCKPYVANAFTPNGDGKNDKFRVLFKGDIKLVDFSIYNRFGQRMFYTTEYQVGWDGTWNNQPQDMGTYFYYVKLICGNKGDNVVEYKGDITLIR